MLAYCHDPGGSLLPSSPCTIIDVFLSVVDHVDNTGGRRRGERTKAEDDGEASDANEQEPGKMHRVLGCDVAMMRARKHNQAWEAGAGVPPALVWLWQLEEEETE